MYIPKPSRNPKGQKWPTLTPPATPQRRRYRSRVLLRRLHYCEAVAYAPKDIDENLKSRLFTYRGAMLKRLNRPSDALPDIEYGLSLAQKDREKGDALYNQACVFAQLGETARLYDTMRTMKAYPQFFAYALADTEGYFAGYSGDDKFQARNFWRIRTKGDVRPPLAMPQCCPSNLPFAA